MRISPLWLFDLEQSYKMSFEHQFEYLNFDQKQRLIHKLGYETVWNSTVREMLRKPRARLFEFENHWGKLEDYHYSRSDRDGMFRGMVKDPMVRLFSGENLTGDYVDYHTGWIGRIQNSIVLEWLKGHPILWNTFLANRVPEVQSILPRGSCHHIRELQNPTLCVSRDISSEEPRDHNLWWSGIIWLKTFTTEVEKAEYTLAARYWFS
ncbi:unnamed protein product [Allacma fusca]|uniref:Uncharacterized protein n=1 Tax=Allacma fusca TaxID=39272 RepID=A0A8J2JN52_9HEXA|nr:unnamed protein product [Allacma fusca]